MRKYYSELYTFYRTEIGALNVVLQSPSKDCSEIFHRVWHESPGAKECLGEFRTSLSDMVTHVRANSIYGMKDLGTCTGMEVAVLKLADNFGLRVLDF